MLCAGLRTAWDNCWVGPSELVQEELPVSLCEVEQKLVATTEPVEWV